MAKVCSLVLMDAVYNTGRFDEDGNELYTMKDLENAVEFAKEMLEKGENFSCFATLESSLFLRWAEEKMKEEGWKKKTQSGERLG